MPRFAANISTLYPEHPLLDRIAAAARDGFISLTPLRIDLTDYAAMRSPALKRLAGLARGPRPPRAR